MKTDISTHPDALQGYAECFETINKLLLRGDVPSAAAVLRQWALDFRAANTRTFYLERVSAGGDSFAGSEKF